MNRPLVVICCSVLKKELLAVLVRDPQDTELIFIDSMLHMHPEKLHQVMADIMADKTSLPCLIIYGDCHAYMNEMEQNPLCARTQGANCGELLLGSDLYKTCRNERDFLFLPEWTGRWREVFQKELGFSDPALAREFMKENRKRLVYLDTGLEPVPARTLREISGFFGMPVKTMTVSLDHLRHAVMSALKRLEGGNTDES